MQSFGASGIQLVERIYGVVEEGERAGWEGRRGRGKEAGVTRGKWKGGRQLGERHRAVCSQRNKEVRHSCLGDLKSKMPSDFQGFDLTAPTARPGPGMEEGSRSRGSEKNPWAKKGGRTENGVGICNAKGTRRCGIAV